MGRLFAKRVTATLAANALPVVDYQNSIFVLSHMRSVSTALTNVLCSHPAISGYGETHVSYARDHCIGQCAVNIMLRRAWKPDGQFVLDKILHNELDVQAPEGFYAAHAVMLLRPPEQAIPSIARLSETRPDLGLSNMNAAGLYYRERLKRLMLHWSRFPPERRIGVVSDDLLADPDMSLRKLGDHIGLVPALRNTYCSHPSSTKNGGGDPIASGKHQRILKRNIFVEPLDVTTMDLSLAQECRVLFEALRAAFSKSVF